MADRLKLVAQDAADLRIVGACLQDSLVPLRDMAFQPSQRRFVLLVNRFRWEKGAAEALDEPGEAAEPENAGPPDASFADAKEGRACFERVHCGVRFEKVRKVRIKGLRRHERHRLLELLTVSAEGNAIDLVFAGGAAIRLEVDAIQCFLEDVGEPWPTSWQPRHAPESAEASTK